MSERIKSIAGKTDIAVKTAESWWSFGREAYQMLGATIAFSGVIIAGAVKLWQSALSVGWEYYALIGPPIFLLSFLVIGFVQMKLALWKRSKSQPEKIEPAEESQIAPLSMSSLEEILERISALEKADNAHEVANVVAPLISGLDKAFQEKFEVFEGKSNRAMDKLFESNKTANSVRFGELHEILKAKTTLSCFDVLTADIESLAERLDETPLRKDWDSLFLAYKSKLKSWDSFEKHFPVMAYRPLFDVDPDTLKSGRWTERVNGLSEDEKIDFKHFRIYKGAFEENKARLHSKILDKAMSVFSGHGCDTRSADLFN